MMNKRKKYLLGTLFLFLSLIVTFSQVTIWENHLKSALMKKINQITEAKIEDGGGGAFYILLKKNKITK